MLKTLHIPKSKKVHRIHRAGLTLVESLVAIAILVIAVFGPMSIIAQAIKSSYFTRDQMTAFYLAQEPMEFVRNVRDRNSLTATDASTWIHNIDNGTLPPTINDPLTSGANPVKYHLFSSLTNGYTLTQCAAVCPPLNYNTDTMIYGEESGTNIIPSRFTREIVFFSVPNDTDALQEVVMQVTVSWQQAGTPYQYKVMNYLKNWKLSN